jgi:LCP family protein required for cell wall assembly
MFKRVTAILLLLIMALIMSYYKAEAVVLYNTGDCGYFSALAPTPQGDDSAAEDGGYLFRYKKQPFIKKSSTGTAVEAVDKKRYKEVTNIAFFGLDESKVKFSSRSDVIMVVSLDSKYEKVKVTSLMRDMYVKIPGKEDNRINAAYSYGGAELALKTINSDFGLDIKNYVTVDLLGLQKIIDSVGGIEIDVKKNEVPYLNDAPLPGDDTTIDKNFVCVSKEGIQILNGRQAVAYARIRYTGNADYERTERQRRVLNELLKKIKGKGILKLPGLVKDMRPYVKTNMSVIDIITLGTKTLKFKAVSIEQYRLPVDGTYKSADIRGMSILVPDMDVNRKKLFQFIYESK